MPKYVFVTGGVMSGLGKGVTTASVSKLLQLSGIRVNCMKIDPYLNFDAGTMNPIAHGEVFVTDDGAEADMDIGTYERFLNQDLGRKNNITTGQIYRTIIDDERKGKFLGKTVQIIPHVTDEIKRRIRTAAGRSQVLVVECGGTVGDIEGLPFLEAFRQMRMEEGYEGTVFIHVTLSPQLDVVGEMKTKPTQHSVQELRRIGIQPDIIVVRSSKPLPREPKEKISLFTSVPMQNVVSDPDVKSIYLAPEMLYKEGILKPILNHLGMRMRRTDIERWNAVASRFVKAKRSVRVAMVGKYASLADSYVSVNEALSHAGAANDTHVDVDLIESEDFEDGKKEPRVLRKYHGIVLPQGYGSRGTEGKIVAANYAREKAIPFLGLCFGFQLSVVSFARHILKLPRATSSEIDPDSPDPVIDILPEQKGIANLGGTMRLGGHNVYVEKPSMAFDVYGKTVIRGRHRHRFELNQEYLPKLEEKGMHFSAFSDGGRRAEILELRDHPFYMATQYHPEYASRPERPEPIVAAFVKASVERLED